jgi:Sybindin-like family
LKTQSWFTASYFPFEISSKRFPQKISSKEAWLISSDGYLTFKTSQYRLGYYQTPTIKFAFFSNPELETGRTFLQRIYEIYVEYVSKNPLIPFDSPIENDLFRSKVKALALAV